MNELSSWSLALVAALAPAALSGQEATTPTTATAGVETPAGSGKVVTPDCEATATRLLDQLKGEQSGTGVPAELRRLCLPDAQALLASAKRCAQEMLDKQAGSPTLARIDGSIQELEARLAEAGAHLRFAEGLRELRGQIGSQKLARSQWPSAELCQSCSQVWELSDLVQKHSGLEAEGRKPASCLALTEIFEAQTKLSSAKAELCAASKSIKGSSDQVRLRFRYYTWTSTGQVLGAFWSTLEDVRQNGWCR